MNELPKCPSCRENYTYIDGDNYICPMCGHEWSNKIETVESKVWKDSNGNTLENGDTVTIIKDLKVKGSSMVAKQGTAVRNIRLDHENAEYIEGKVDGQQIVIITQYVKKI